MVHPAFAFPGVFSRLAVPVKLTFLDANRKFPRPNAQPGEQLGRAECRPEQAAKVTGVSLLQAAAPLEPRRCARPFANRSHLLATSPSACRGPFMAFRFCAQKLTSAARFEGHLCFLCCPLFSRAQRRWTACGLVALGGASGFCFR